MSDANRVRLAIVAESAFGVTPSTPTMKIQRITRESLHQMTSTINSNEIRSDRQIPDVSRVDVGAEGDIEGELSYGNWDDLLGYLLQSAGWSSPVTVGPISSATAVASDNSYNGTGIGTGIVANQWVKVTGYATAGNNGFVKAVTVTANKVIVTGKTLVDESGASATLVLGAQIVNGTTAASLAIERTYVDLTNIFALYNGMSVNQFTMAVQNQQIITGKFSLMGTTELSKTAATGSSYTAAPTAAVMETVDNVLAIMENYSSFGVTQLNLSIANNLRKRSIVGTLGPISVGSGTINANGNFTVYFATHAMMDKYLAFTETAISFTLVDTAGNAYVFEFPAVKLTAGDRMATGINTDIMANFNFQAKLDASELITIRIARFAA